MSDDESREIFREEALDLLSELESSLLELETSPQDMDLVNQVFRALHTIKGSGAMFGFDDIADFTHALESVFDKLRNQELEVTRELISTSFAARDHILGLLNGVDEFGNGSPEKGEAIQAEVLVLMSGKLRLKLQPRQASRIRSLQAMRRKTGRRARSANQRRFPCRTASPYVPATRR